MKVKKTDKTISGYDVFCGCIEGRAHIFFLHDELEPIPAPVQDDVVEVLTELLRLYDLRNMLAGRIKMGVDTEYEQQGALVKYGREKKAAWEAARKALAAAGIELRKVGE